MTRRRLSGPFLTKIEMLSFSGGWRRDTPERSAEVLGISSVELKERENNALDYLEPHLSSRMRSDSFDAILPTRLPKRVKSSAAP
jgi:hypothetical protein